MIYKLLKSKICPFCKVTIQPTLVCTNHKDVYINYFYNIEELNIDIKNSWRSTIFFYDNTIRIYSDKRQNIFKKISFFEFSSLEQYINKINLIITFS